MTLVDREQELAAGDEAAVADLRRSFEAQKAAFKAHPLPTPDERRSHLEALAGMMMANRQRIREALAADFAVHPDLFSDLIECAGIPARALFAISQLDAWMADDERQVDPSFFGTARAFVRYQPKGVVGNIVPWNFPFDIGIGPLVEMLAAGNRAIVKPSDFTPACGELMADMIGSTFDADHVTVAVGGLELARTFPTLAWDHLLYTGSPAIGRVIARAAADNLVPTTLELGGKCPTVVLDDAVDEETVSNILGTKMIKNGQMCISVDYVLVPRRQMAEFTSLARRHISARTPAYSRSGDCTGIITNRHLDRLVELSDEARDAGYEVVEIEEGGRLNRDTRQMPLVLVLDPGDELKIMQEEIFGPILPIKPYDDVDEAVAYINDNERPLGLYVFGHDEARTGDVLRRTTSGGACVNASRGPRGPPLPRVRRRREQWDGSPSRHRRLP